MNYWHNLRLTSSKVDVKMNKVVTSYFFLSLSEQRKCYSCAMSTWQENTEVKGLWEG